MSRIVLIVLGLVLVGALILAPEPSEVNHFTNAIGQSLAGDPEGTPPLFLPLVDAGLVPPADAPPDAHALHLVPGAVEWSPEPEDPERSAEALREAVERAVNQINGERPQAGDAPRLWPRVVLDPAGDAAAGAVTVDLRVATIRSESFHGVDVGATFRPPDGAPLSWELEQPYRYPSRLSLLPPLLAISIAILFRRVLIALFSCVWLAAAFLTRWGELPSPWAPRVLWPPAPGSGVPGWLALAGESFLRVFDTYLYQHLVDSFRIEIIAFTIFLTAAVGVMSRSGGMQGLVQSVLRIARGVRSSQLATFLMGFVIFFDDYANCILIGTTMRPVTDRLKIAREKLAFLVDSTAAPVAALAILSTWIAFETSTYSAQLPAVGIEESAYWVFLQTIPYRFYAIFLLGFIFLNILVQRDFGSMLHAERRARHRGQVVSPAGRPVVSDVLTRIEPKPSMPPRARRAVLPILTVVLVTLVTIWIDGGGPLPWSAAGLTGWSVLRVPDWTFPALDSAALRAIVTAGAGTVPILYGAFSGLVVALFLALGAGARLGLVSGWILAAALTGGVSKALHEKMLAYFSSRASPGSAEDLGTLGHRFLQDTLESGSLAASLPYFVFLGLFLAGTATVGLLAAALLGEGDEEHPSDVLTAPEALRATLAATRAMGLAIAILFLAWMIGSACQDLKTASYLVAQVSGQMGKVYWLLPVLLFLVSCLISFATGSSWSTMGILLPIVVVLAHQVGEQATGITGMQLLILSIGAVLEGSIFGDHCSPISDTTVLSSVASASDHIDHVRTQMPYAITVMLVALLVGYVPQALSLWHWGVSLALGFAILLAILLIFGRNPNVDEEPDGEGPWEDEEPAAAEAPGA